MLSYLLSWYVLPSDPWSKFIHSPLVILLTKVKTLALLHIYPGSLFFRLDESIKNTVWTIRHYHVVNHAVTAFLQVLLWERFGTLSPRPIQFEAIEMIEVEVDVEIIERPDRL